MGTEYCKKFLNGKARETYGVVECYEECPHGLQKGIEEFELDTETHGIKKGLKLCSTKGIIPSNMQRGQEIHHRKSLPKIVKKIRYFVGTSNLIKVQA